MTSAPPPPSPGDDHPLKDIASIPLRLDVCFNGIEMSVAELSRLRDRSVIPLPAQAPKTMRLLHNGHCIAIGELVQVGDALAIQLTQAPQLA